MQKPIGSTEKMYGVAQALNKDKLEEAPGFEKYSAWPDFADRIWGLGIHQYFGYGPYWDD